MANLRLHPIAIAILSPLGALAFVDCGTSGSSGCGPYESHTESCGDGEVEVEGDERIYEDCANLVLDVSRAAESRPALAARPS